jgi:glucose-1-phosphate cytidylyltransferase
MLQTGPQELLLRLARGSRHVKLQAVKTVILAGGLGTRLSEETANRPKTMVEIGGKPILWHLLGIYSAAGYRDFIVAAGYKQELIKKYFHQFYTYNNDLTIDLATGETTIRERDLPHWTISVIDTGLATMTGGRLKRLRSIIGDHPFMCTYGDGLASIDIDALVRAHQDSGRLATLTAVRPPARFGALELEGNRVKTFVEKTQTSEGWINGGFFVFEPEVLDRIAGDATLLEQEPLAQLAADSQLTVYRHEGFWQPMDTLRDKRLLEELWASGNALWANTRVPA